MATDPTQRYYRAPCPSCGAPVEFLSASAPYAVCGYCRSTVVRSGDQLKRIGRMAELFDDHSPLQLMASGRVTLDGREQPFTLVGRLQYKSDAGVWSEWIAALDDGRTATLGEDNGSYVFTQADSGTLAPPQWAKPEVGGTITVAGQSWVVAFSGAAQLIAAEGELPTLAPLGQPLPEQGSEQAGHPDAEFGVLVLVFPAFGSSLLVQKMRFLCGHILRQCQYAIGQRLGGGSGQKMHCRSHIIKNVQWRYRNRTATGNTVAHCRAR